LKVGLEDYKNQHNNLKNRRICVLFCAFLYVLSR